MVEKFECLALWVAKPCVYGNKGKCNFHRPFWQPSYNKNFIISMATFESFVCQGLNGQETLANITINVSFLINNDPLTNLRVRTQQTIVIWHHPLRYAGIHEPPLQTPLTTVSTHFKVNCEYFWAGNWHKQAICHLETIKKVTWFKPLS